MAEQAVIGKPYVFQTQFLDGNNNPVAVEAPTLDIFCFSTAGARNSLVTGAAMTPVVPAEVGRYVYVYTIPSVFTDGDMLYADAAATLGGLQYRASAQVVLIASTRSGGGRPGLVARVVY